MYQRLSPVRSRIILVLHININLLFTSSIVILNTITFFSAKNLTQTHNPILTPTRTTSRHMKTLAITIKANHLPIKQLISNPVRNPPILHIINNVQH